MVSWLIPAFFCGNCCSKLVMWRQTLAPSKVGIEQLHVNTAGCLRNTHNVIAMGGGIVACSSVLCYSCKCQVRIRSAPRCIVTIVFWQTLSLWEISLYSMQLQYLICCAYHSTKAANFTHKHIVHALLITTSFILLYYDEHTLLFWKREKLTKGSNLVVVLVWGRGGGNFVWQNHTSHFCCIISATLLLLASTVCVKTTTGNYILGLQRKWPFSENR